MRFSKQILAAVTLAVPFVSAQSLAELPACALTAATSGISATGCKATDYSCLCRATSFLTALQGQVSTSCSASDYAATLSFAQKACSNVGITLSLPSSAAGPVKPVTSATSPSAAAAAAGHGGTSKSSSSPPVTVPTTTTNPLSSSSSSNGTANNITNGTIPPVVPFEGLATSNSFQWASVALLVGTVAAFAGL